MGKYWIFGASKPLGVGLTKTLRQAHEVTCFSRSLPPGEQQGPAFVQLDFCDLDSTRAAINDRLAAGAPQGAIFCQRYRPADGQTDLVSVKAGLDVELAPVLALIDGARALNPGAPLSIVLISSVAGIAVHADIPLYYHLLKALTVAAAKVLAVHGAAENIRVNCIILGEFEKYPRDGYSEKEKAKFGALEEFTLSGRMCRVSDITDLTEFLLSEKSAYVTGQVITLDGGLSSLAPESVVRALVAKPKP